MFIGLGIGYVVFVYFFVLETRRSTIEEVSRLFDGENVVADLEEAHDQDLPDQKVDETDEKVSKVQLAHFERA